MPKRLGIESVKCAAFFQAHAGTQIRPAANSYGWTEPHVAPVFKRLGQRLRQRLKIESREKTALSLFQYKLRFGQPVQPVEDMRVSRQRDLVGGPCYVPHLRFEPMTGMLRRCKRCPRANANHAQQKDQKRNKQLRPN